MVYPSTPPAFMIPDWIMWVFAGIVLAIYLWFDDEGDL